MTNKDLKKRILAISYKYKLSHLGSCLTAVDIIEEIYQLRKENEPFVLSAGHAGLALYVVLEKHYAINAEGLFKQHGVHPSRDLDNHIWCSSGSLGHGLPISLGMALADRSKDVYCLISDGECSEGSIWEALNIRQEQEAWNLKTYINFNGWAAYKKLDGLNISTIIYKDLQIRHTDVEQLPFLQGQDAHYHVMNEQEFKEGMSLLV